MESRLGKRIFRLKKDVPFDRNGGDALPRHFSTFDLLCVGIGSTIGSGVFVLTGLIATDIAGPYTPICWLIAGLASLLSAWSYAELSYKIPQSGSSYVYCYKLIGELPAYLSAACLTLEYGISAAAVARSWGEKLDVWLMHSFSIRLMSSGGSLNFPAALLQIICVLVLLLGVDVSKKAINVFTTLKVILIVFIIICGLVLFNGDNLKETGGLYDGSGEIGAQNPTAAVSTGGAITAVLTGTTTCFFGYVGYDEVCCLSGESANPSSMPRAVFGTIALSSVLYIIASLALIGMQSYHDINADSGFSLAFAAQSESKWKIVGQITAIGELVALPLVVLISFLAQPRLLFAMAQDKLAPALFARVNGSGNLTSSILVSGFACAVLALLVPFAYLESMVSAGILINFNLTNIAFLNMRWFEQISEETRARSSSATTAVASIAHSTSLSRLLVYFNVLSILLCVSIVNAMLCVDDTVRLVLAILSVCLAVFLCMCSRGIYKMFNNGRLGDLELVDTLARSPNRPGVRSPDIELDDYSGKGPGGSGGYDADAHAGRDAAVDIGVDVDVRVDMPGSGSDRNWPYALRAPWFPTIPLLAIWINWFLFVQLPTFGFAMLGAYFALATICYAITCYSLDSETSDGVHTAGENSKSCGLDGSMNGDGDADGSGGGGCLPSVGKKRSGNIGGSGGGGGGGSGRGSLGNRSWHSLGQSEEDPDQDQDQQPVVSGMHSDMVHVGIGSGSDSDEDDF